MSEALALRGGVAQALGAYLLAIADDELITGHRHSEWTGLGPDIESDVALSSIAQEEMGHARLFYQEVLRLTGRGEEELDRLVFDRPAAQFRHAVLLERPNGDWGFTIVRLVLYELADALRLTALTRLGVESLPALARALQREEKYHQMYADAWLTRLARATPDSHTRIQDALDVAWGEARGLFEPVPEEPLLLEAGVLAEAAAAQERAWQERIAELCGRLDLRVPPGTAAVGGRRGEHSPDLAVLLAEMTEVRRGDPGAVW